MPYVSPFTSRRRQVIPSPKQNTPIVRTDLRGLDLTTPFDVLKENRSPFARNFRIYAEESDDRRVAISSRLGAGFYTTPLSEALDQSNTSATGAADASVGITSEWKAMKFTAGVSAPLTMVELRLKKTDSSAGPVIVEIYSNVSGAPGQLLASSSILNADIATSYNYEQARFVEAPALVSGTVYWIVAYVQEDGAGVYSWSSNTASTLALTSNTTGQSWAATAYSLNFKTYNSSSGIAKGLTRFAPTSGVNKTLIPIGTVMYAVDDSDGSLDSIATGLDASAQEYQFTYADNKVFWVNGFDDLKTWDGTSIETITHSELPVLQYATFHKNRLFGVSAADPNKLIFSEDPGNDDGSGNEWYEGYLSTSFIYIPAPKASDPITAIVPFQDNLVIFTRTSKWILYGSDPGSFTVRQSSGKKGAVSSKGIYADENFIYFVGDDGFYRYNGSEDTIISDRVQTEFSNIADKEDVYITKWKRQVRFYYASSGSAVNNCCLIWHTVFEEWMLDTDAYVSYATPLTDGEDEYQLVEVSSTAPTAYYAEQQGSILGKQIDFLYYCKYDSMGLPAVRKRAKKFFPLLEGDGGNYFVEVGMDKDREDDTRYSNFDLATSAARIGEFNVGDGTLLGRDASFAPSRIRIPGYWYYGQVRIKRKAVDNPVRFIGYVLSIKMKRL